MKEDEMIEGLQSLVVPSSSSSIVAIAVNGDSKSKYVVEWALEKFAVEDKVLFKLLHVRPIIKSVPTPSKFFLSV